MRTACGGLLANLLSALSARNSDPDSIHLAQPEKQLAHAARCSLNEPQPLVRPSTQSVGQLDLAGLGSGGRAALAAASAASLRARSSASSVSRSAMACSSSGERLAHCSDVRG